MRLFLKIKFDKLKNFLKKFSRNLGEHSFLAFLVLFCLSLILGGFIFYKYVFLIKKIEPQIIEKPLQFEEKTYQKILNEWQGREKRFKETDLKKYLDPFKGLTPAPAEELTH